MGESHGRGNYVNIFFRIVYSDIYMILKYIYIYISNIKSMADETIDGHTLWYFNIDIAMENHNS